MSGAQFRDSHDRCASFAGNWAHTCDRDLLVEGPCNGKCMLKARCKDLKEKFAVCAEGAVSRFVYCPQKHRLISYPCNIGGRAMVISSQFPNRFPVALCFFPCFFVNPIASPPPNNRGPGPLDRSSQGGGSRGEGGFSKRPIFFSKRTLKKKVLWHSAAPVISRGGAFRRG